MEGAASRSHYFKTISLAAKYTAVLKKVAIGKRKGI
jgi:hypothetical protein